MLYDPFLRTVPPEIKQIIEKRLLCVHLARYTQARHLLFSVYPVQRRFAVGHTLKIFLSDYFPQESKRTELFVQACVERDLVKPILDLIGCFRDILAHQRIDLDDHDAAGIRFIY